MVLLGGMSIMFLVIGFLGSGECEYVNIIMLTSSSLPVLILFGMIAFAPRQYQITADSILVNRYLAKDITIPRIEVYSVEPVSYKYVFKKSIRICGSGGGFGIYGSFTSPSMKDFKAYMTRRDKLVMIKTAHKPFVLTPDDPEGFIIAASEKAKP
jgi:hypothetical protein